MVGELKKKKRKRNEYFYSVIMHFQLWW